jgi:hypothetical protein
MGRSKGGALLALRRQAPRWARSGPRPPRPHVRKNRFRGFASSFVKPNQVMPVCGVSELPGQWMCSSRWPIERILVASSSGGFDSSRLADASST